MQRKFLYSDTKTQGAALLAHGVCTAVAHANSGGWDGKREAQLVEHLGGMEVGDYVHVGPCVIVRLKDVTRGANL